MDTSPAHLRNVKKSLRILKPIQYVTKQLQKTHLTLSKGWDLFQALTLEIFPKLRQDEGFVVNDDRIRLESKKNKFLKDPVNYHFEKAVIKVQTGLEHLLSADERSAARKLRKGYNPFGLSLSSNTIGEEQLEQQRIEEDIEKESDPLVKKLKEVFHRKETGVGSKYIDTSFIGCSTANVELMWTICNLILTHNRASLSNEMFEALIYLCMNRRFWDEMEVSEAFRATIDRSVKQSSVGNDDFSDFSDDSECESESDSDSDDDDDEDILGDYRDWFGKEFYASLVHCLNEDDDGDTNDNEEEDGNNDDSEDDDL